MSDLPKKDRTCCEQEQWSKFWTGRLAFICSTCKKHWRWSIDRQEWMRDDPKPKPAASVSDGREWHDYSQGLRP